MIAPTSSAEAALPRQGRQQALPPPPPLPPVCGFALALGPGPAHDNPRFAQLGEHTHLEETAGGVPWTGTLIGQGTLARDGNTALVLAGELYNRDDLAHAAGGDAGGNES